MTGFAGLEPEAEGAATRTEAAILSIAVSLKRIADLAADPYGLNAVMENAGQAFEVGRRGR